MKEKSVLLADRHSDMLESIRGLLEAEYSTVVMVSDRKSLFDTIEKLHPDLAVVDLSLPSSGEVNVAHELKTAYPDLKLIILSVQDESGAAQQVMSAGASGFVLKRSAGTDLFEAIERIEQGQTYISPSLIN